MKPFRGRSLLIAAALILVYVLGLALSILAIGYYPVFQKQREMMLLEAHIIADHYVEAVGNEVPDYLSHLTVRILIYDGEGRLQRSFLPNRGAETTDYDALLLPYQAATLAGEDVFAFVPAQFQCREWSQYWMIAGTPVRSGGAVSGSVFFIKNLENLQEALVCSGAFFTAAYWLAVYVILAYSRKMRKLEKLRQTYVDNVTHAMKTPIASIKALAETLCDGVEPDPERQRTYYGMILREANRQDHMVRDVLELSKLQNHGISFEVRNVPAAEIFDPIVEKYAALCDCADITLRVSETAASLPPLHTDAACIRQVLEIILDNALKFTPVGGEISIEAKTERTQAVFCVRDNGPGIPAEALGKVFDRFYKGSHDFYAGGNGLGLAIAKELMDGLKEKIWAESEPGHGAAFCFTVRTGA